MKYALGIFIDLKLLLNLLRHICIIIKPQLQKQCSIVINILLEQLILPLETKLSGILIIVIFAGVILKCFNASEKIRAPRVVYGGDWRRHSLDAKTCVLLDAYAIELMRVLQLL